MLVLNGVCSAFVAIIFEQLCVLQISVLQISGLLGFVIVCAL